MSRRQRERANSRPWREAAPSEPRIDWQALAADRQRREHTTEFFKQQYQLKPTKGTP